MKKHGEELFQIGEVSKIMGISRKALLVYEDMGLLTPVVTDRESGYRYYSADNITQIRSIRFLQAPGLTLKEISEYYYDTENIDAHLQRRLYHSDRCTDQGMSEFGFISMAKRTAQNALSAVLVFSQPPR